MTSSPLSLVGSGSRRPGMLIGDAERDTVCQQLATHFAAGRLTADELDSRVNAAMAARTNVELHLLTADLPRNEGNEPPVAQPPAPMVVPAPVQPNAARDGAAAVAYGLGFFTTLAAIACTSILLLSVLVTGVEMAPVVWLGAFGTTVSVAGAMFYGGQFIAARRARALQAAQQAQAAQAAAAQWAHQPMVR